MFRVAFVPHNLKGRDITALLVEEKTRSQNCKVTGPRSLSRRCRSWDLNPGLPVTNITFFGAKDAGGDF